jgi:glycerate-2-kinase
MLAAPVDGVTLAEKSETSRALMAAGAAIHELNCVRKHLSRIKGGHLAAAARRTVTLALSDVHGPVPDDPSVIGSGPTVADETTFADALGILRGRRVEAPPTVVEHLERGARGDAPETVKPGDPRLQDCVYRIIGNRQTAVDGAASAAARLGYRVAIIDPASSGEARDAGRTFALEARRLARASTGRVCILGSGETTVTVRGAGKGGRNQEFALGAALALSQPIEAPAAESGAPVVLASAGTDGIDGPTDAAGAVVDLTTLERAAGRGLDPAAALAANDTYRFFEALGDLIIWKPTGTNVGDLHVALAG